MQNAETVLGVLRERGRRGLPCTELYRQLFNPHLYLLAYGRLYSNQGAMTPGVDGETVDGMSLGKTGRIIDALRHEAPRHIPSSAGRNSKGGSWVRWLTWTRKREGTVAWCATKRFVVSPAQPGRIRRKVLGPDASPGVERQREQQPGSKISDRVQAYGAMH